MSQLCKYIGPILFYVNTFMIGFDPNIVCHPFKYMSISQKRRSGKEILFIEQNSHLFCVKIYGASEEAKKRIQRELIALEAFSGLGVKVLRPVFGPVDDLRMIFPDRTVSLHNVILYPFFDKKTFFDIIKQKRNPTNIVAEAGQYMRYRHALAKTLSAIHSDGGPQNIFEDWTYFDFDEQHASEDLQIAKAIEVWKFISGVIKLIPISQADFCTSTFCKAYGMNEIIKLAYNARRPESSLSEKHLQLHMFFKIILCDITRFTRLLTWKSLLIYLKDEEQAHREVSIYKS